MTTTEQRTSPEVSRRGFLLGSLASAITVTAGGATGLLLATGPARADETFVADVTGSYAFRDAASGCRVSVMVRNGTRRIRSNGLPNHATGSFPNANNPNTISSQNYDYSLPTSPKRQSGIESYSLPQPFGIAVNGVLFDPLAAEWFNRDPRSGWSYDAMGGGISLGLDVNHAHVQPTGAYHYHGTPTGLAEVLGGGRHSPLVGWAGDGFPIYLNRGYRKPGSKSSGVKALRSSYVLKSGTRGSGPGGDHDGTFNEDWEYRRGTGDLDAANGRFQVTPEFPRGTYCYILTSTFPVIPRAFRGAIATTFVKSGPAGAGPGGPPGGGLRE
jgi:hypothetical protein